MGQTTLALFLNYVSSPPILVIVVIQHLLHNYYYHAVQTNGSMSLTNKQWATFGPCAISEWHQFPPWVEDRYLKDIIFTGFFFFRSRVSSQLRPWSRVSKRGATHQNAIRSTLAHSPSPKLTEQSIRWWCFFWSVLTNQLRERWVVTPGSLSMNWVRDSGRRRCGHVNKSISGALDGWDL